MQRTIAVIIALISLILPYSHPAQASGLLISDVQIQNETSTLDGVEVTTIRFDVSTNTKIGSGKLTAVIENDPSSKVYSSYPSGHVYYTNDENVTIYTYFYSFNTDLYSSSDTLPASKTLRYTVELTDSVDPSFVVKKSDLFTTSSTGTGALNLSTPTSGSTAQITDTTINPEYWKCIDAIDSTLRADLKEFSIRLDLGSYVDAKSFLCESLLPELKVGAGERRALLRDYLDTIGYATINFDNISRIANGLKPANRNLAKEQAKAATALRYFKVMYGHAPNFQNKNEDLAWNTLMYRIRFTRDLTKERNGIAMFQQKFKYIPKSPIDWAAVRALGYIGK